MPSPVLADRPGAWRYAVPLAVGAVVRGIWLAQLELPAFDPWRHLLLVDNLRAGHGFTLFDGQPYLWYNPGWHHLLALWPRTWDPAWPAVLLSLAAIPLFQRFLETVEDSEQAPLTGTVGAILWAGFGPGVAFTCHYGPEAFAVFLLFAGLVLGAVGRNVPSAAAAGLLFGLALTARLNLLFSAFLFLPLLRRRDRGAAWGLFALLPLAAVWLRNRAILANHPFVFTWDGLATRSADFHPLSTLVVQLHPAVQAGLRRLHERIVPVPEWFRDADGLRPDLTLFMVLAVLALLLCRRLPLALAGLVTLAYFLLLDASLSSNFFRIYLALFPAALAALAVVIAGLWQRSTSRARASAVALMLLIVIAGAPSLIPPTAPEANGLTPPAQLLRAERYFVNSGAYHPESVMYRYPTRQFLGLPLDPLQFAELRRNHPEVRHILWHDINLQSELRESLERAGNPLIDSAATPGRNYVVMQLIDAPPPDP